MFFCMAIFYSVVTPFLPSCIYTIKIKCHLIVIISQIEFGIFLIMSLLPDLKFEFESNSVLDETTLFLHVAYNPDEITMEFVLVYQLRWA